MKRGVSRRLLFVAIAALTALPLAAESDLAGISLRADLSKRLLQVIENNQVVSSYDIAVGADDYPTPTGDFLIQRMIWNPAWVPPDADWAKDKTRKEPGDPKNPMKVVKIFFQEPDYYIHGTGDVDSLGSAASHGCIRMAPSDVRQLAQTIMERGGKPLQPSWIRRVFRRGLPDEVRLEKPVPLSVSP